MSRSPYHSPTGEAGLPGFSTLNAAATPFSMPLTPVMSCNSPLSLVSPRSALRPSAPAFIAPVATMVTPQSSVEHVTETSSASPYEQPWADDGSLSLGGDATGELDCDFTDLEFDADEIMNFAHFDDATYDTQGVECATLDPALDGDMAEQHSQTTQCAAALNSDMAVQNAAVTYPAAPKDVMAAQLPQLTQNAAINDEMAAQHPQLAHDAAINDTLAAQHPQFAHDAALNMAAHYPQTTQDAVHGFPIYHPEHVQWTGDAYATDEHYLHPSIEDDFDFGLATATGAQDDGATAYPSPPSLTFGGSSPEENVRTDTEDGDGEYVEDIDGEGETDDEYQSPEDNNASNTGRNPRSTANMATVDAAPAIEIVQPSFAVKQRKANIIIAKQNAQKDLARGLGQHVRVTHSNGRIEIDGIYWKAPANDFTIPRTDAEKLPYIHTIVNCIRSNENVKEVQTTGSFRHRWADGATYFSDEEVLASACKIVDTMVDIHTRGWTKQIFDPKTREQCQKTMFCTFEERYNELCDLLTFSKTTCIDVLKEERFFTAIGNPWELNTRSSSNQMSNGNKNSILKEHGPAAAAMRKAAEMGKRKRDEMEGGKAQGQEQIDARPKKVAKRTARK